MDRELMRSDYSDDIELLDWTGNEHYEDNIDDDISFAPAGGALVPLYDKLRNSKRGGLHISKGNSSYYSAVMSDMDAIIVMMGSDFTGDTETNLKKIADMQSLYHTLAKSCDEYTARGAKTRSGKAREAIVREIKQIADRDIYTLGAIYSDFTHMKPEEQEKKNWESLIGEGRVKKLTVSDFSSFAKADGGNVSEVYKISDKDGRFTGVDAGKELGLQFFKPEDLYYFDEQKNDDGIISDMKERFPSLSKRDLKNAVHRYKNVDAQEKDYPLSNMGLTALDYMEQRRSGQKTQRSEIIDSSGMKGKNGAINMSRRNVATSRIASLLGIGHIVAASETVDIYDEKSGKTIRGNLMEGAEGKNGDYLLDESVKTKRQDLFKVSGAAARDLISLQVLDVICGQMDRHRNNILFQHDENEITKITGIDNDASFGLNDDIVLIANEQRKDRRVVNKETGKLSIPFMDKKLADRISSVDSSMFDFILSGLLTQDEINAAKKRFDEVKTAVNNSSDTTEFLKNESDWTEDIQNVFHDQTKELSKNLVTGMDSSRLQEIAVKELTETVPELSGYEGPPNIGNLIGYAKQFPNNEELRKKILEVDRKTFAREVKRNIDSYKAYGTYFSVYLHTLSNKPIKGSSGISF